MAAYALLSIAFGEPEKLYWTPRGCAISLSTSILANESLSVARLDIDCGMKDKRKTTPNETGRDPLKYKALPL